MTVLLQCRCYVFLLFFFTCSNLFIHFNFFCLFHRGRCRDEQQTCDAVVYSLCRKSYNMRSQKRDEERREKREENYLYETAAEHER